MSNQIEPMMTRSQKNKQGKRKSRKTILYSIVFVFLVLIGIGAVWGTGLYNRLMSTFNSTYNNVGRSELRGGNSLTLDENLKKFSVLILGVDTGAQREAEGLTQEDARTDAMILATVNLEDGRVDLVSIPRDTLTYVQDVDYYDKITHAHALTHSPKGSMEAVESLLAVPVDYYAQINFDAFEAVVDKLGGVEIDVPYDIWDYDLTYIQIYAGKQVLNGQKALEYVRARAQDSDMARGQRQMEVIQAILKKATSLGNIGALTELMDIAGKNLSHNFTQEQINTLMTSVLSKSLSLHKHQIKGYDLMYNGVYYYYPSARNLMELSTVLNYQLGRNVPSKRELMNARYAGYIYPLSTGVYNAKSTLSGRELGLLPAALNTIIPQTDYFEYLPEVMDAKSLIEEFDREETASSSE